MSRLKEWKIAKKVAASGKRGIVVGILIAVFVLALVAVAIIKFSWIKKTFFCNSLDDLDDYYLDDDMDDDGLAYTSDKDFV